jgi:hypothetical protein
MNLLAVALGVVGIGLITRAILIGSAAPDGQSLNRDDEPIAYWAALMLLVGITGFLFWLGLHGK